MTLLLRTIVVPPLLSLVLSQEFEYPVQAQEGGREALEHPERSDRFTLRRPRLEGDLS